MHVFVCVCVSYFLVTKLDAIVAQPKASALLRYCWVVFVVASVQVRTVYVMYYTNLHIIVCDSAGFTWCACRLVDLVFGRLRRILASLSLALKTWHNVLPLLFGIVMCLRLLRGFLCAPRYIAAMSMTLAFI